MLRLGEGFFGGAWGGGVGVGNGAQQWEQMNAEVDSCRAYDMGVCLCKSGANNVTLRLWCVIDRNRVDERCSSDLWFRLSGIRLHIRTCACLQKKRQTTKNAASLNRVAQAALCVHAKKEKKNVYLLCFSYEEVWTVQEDCVFHRDISLPRLLLMCMWKFCYMNKKGVSFHVPALGCSVCVSICASVFVVLTVCTWVCLCHFFPLLCCTVCIMVSWGFRATPAPVSSVVDHWST